jgi:hypothetical protein
LNASGSQPATPPARNANVHAPSAPASPKPAANKPAPQTTSAASAPVAQQQGAPRVSSRPASRRVTSSAATWTGWGVEWARPGELRERHIWQVPVVAKRQVPRTFLGLPFGTRTEKYAERHEERVEDLGYKLGGHRLEITSLAFTLDARLLVSGSRDGTVRVWNVKRGREACAPLVADSAVVATALVPDHTVVAVVLDDRAVILWDHGPKRRVVHLEAPDHTAFRAVAASNDGQWIAAGGAGRRLQLWNTERGVAGTEFQRATGRIEAIAFTPDGSGIVCATHKSRLELFDRASGEPRWSIRTTCGRVLTLFASRHTGGVIGAARGRLGGALEHDRRQRDAAHAADARAAGLARVDARCREPVDRAPLREGERVRDRGQPRGGIARRPPGRGHRDRDLGHRQVRRDGLHRRQHPALGAALTQPR